MTAADELRALTVAATPGPWGWRGNDDGAVELTALHSGYQRVLTTVRSEPCIIYTEAEGLIVTDEACDDCRAEAAKMHDPFDGYRCPKEANLGTIWLQDLDAHVIRPANTWAVREVPYRHDVVAVEHPDAELIVWCRNHADALADLIEWACDATTYAPNGDPDCAHSAGDGTTGLCVHCEFNPAIDRLARALAALGADA